MKKLFLIIVYILPFFAAAQNSITVQVTGIDQIEGNIYIGLYNNKIGFTELDYVYKYKIVPANQRSITAIMEDIPTGTYAISVFHDKNSNGYLDKNFVGYPSEVYGFSNNQRAIFSAPSYESCLFLLDQDIQLDIELK